MIKIPADALQIELMEAVYVSDVGTKARKQTSLYYTSATMHEIVM